MYTQVYTKLHYEVTNKIYLMIASNNKYLKFSEFKQHENSYHFHLRTKVKFMFSVRTSRDAQILICNGKDYDRDLCYWIIIGGWNNTLSVIRKCTTGVPLPGRRASSDCEKALVSYRVNRCTLCFSFLESLLLRALRIVICFLKYISNKKIYHFNIFMLPTICDIVRLENQFKSTKIIARSLWCF